MSDFGGRKRVDELRDLPFAEIRRGDQLIEILTRKLQGLDRNIFQEELLEGRVRLLLDLLTEALADRFQDLSLMAFAHIVIAMDHFLKVEDSVPDTFTGGYSDDLKAIQDVFTNFEHEIDAFKIWRARQPKDSLV